LFIKDVSSFFILPFFKAGDAGFVVVALSSGIAQPVCNNAVTANYHVRKD
jgi:hypothetical protein